MNTAPASTDELLLAIVHDARAYLRPNLTGAQLLARAIPNLPDSNRAQLESVIQAGKQLERFLGRLADYANSAYAYAARPTPVEVILQGITLHFSGLPVDVAAGADIASERAAAQVATIVQELVDNALKFSANKPVRVIAESAGDALARIQVADSGIGIVEEHYRHIVAPLVRLHSRDEYPGFGLGLAIATRLAESVGAALTFGPNSDQGTIATVTFPTL